MKRYLLILIFLPLFTFCKQTKDEKANTEIETAASEKTTKQSATYYLIRHAEKDRTDPNNDDPNLNIDGLKRAKRWAAYFETYQMDQIYTTKYIRNKQTISMVAQQKALKPILYDPHNVNIDEFLKDTNGKNVLIVGHSNTVPKMVNALIGKEEYKDMDDADNATLYKVTINGKTKIAEIITVE